MLVTSFHQNAQPNWVQNQNVIFIPPTFSKSDTVLKYSNAAFLHYFPDFEHDSPVIAHDRNLIEQSLDLIHDSSTEASSVDEILTELWSMIVLKPLQLLTVFQSIFTCESTFSSAVAVKVESRNRLFDLKSDLRCVI